jgi:hypothetical protein
LAWLESDYVDGKNNGDECCVEQATSKFLGQMRLLLTEDEECQCDRGLPYLEVIVPVHFEIASEITSSFLFSPELGLGP